MDPVNLIFKLTIDNTIIDSVSQEKAVMQIIKCEFIIYTNICKQNLEKMIKRWTLITHQSFLSERMNTREKKLKRDEKNAEYMKKELSSIPKTHKYFPLYAGLIKLMQIKKMDTAFVSTFD